MCHSESFPSIVECQYAGCNNAECCYTMSHPLYYVYAEFCYTQHQYPKCQYANCHYAESMNAQCYYAVQC